MLSRVASPAKQHGLEGGITSGMASTGLANQSTMCKKDYAQGGGRGTFTACEPRAAAHANPAARGAT